MYDSVDGRRRDPPPRGVAWEPPETHRSLLESRAISNTSLRPFRRLPELDPSSRLHTVTTSNTSRVEKTRQEERTGYGKSKDKAKGKGDGRTKYSLRWLRLDGTRLCPLTQAQYRLQLLACPTSSKSVPVGERWDSLISHGGRRARS